MGYFNETRGRAIVLCFLASSLLLAAFPRIDLFVSGLFYSDGFPFSGSPLQRLIRDVTSGFVYLAIFGTAAVYLFNRLLGGKLWGIDGRRLSYLCIVLVIGAGFIVNFALKDNFGRARPREIVEFGGTRSFTAAFSVSRECRSNCSFSSGEAAAGFFSIALAYALSRRRAALAAALAFGTLVSLARIASGAHFLSDTVVSFFVMLLLADSLHYYLRLEPPEIGIVPAADVLVRVGTGAVTPPQPSAASSAKRTTPAG